MKHKQAVLTIVSAAALLMGATRPIATVSRTIATELDFSNQPAPVFRNGYLVARHKSPLGFSIWDNNNRLINHQEISLPNAVSVVVLDAAASSLGAVALIVSGLDEQRRYNSAILWASVTGPVTRIVAMEGFAPSKIVFAGDGTLWAFGRAYGPSFEEPADYDTLRHYDSSGKFIGSTLKRSTFQSKSKISPSTDSFLIMGGDRVGILSIAASEWVELTVTGEILGRGPIDIPSGSFITGAALVADKLYVSQQKAANRATSTLEATELYQLDKTSNQFLEVDSTQVRNGKQGAVILGVDGEHLVVRVKPPWALAWVVVN